jgi:hypothetical protein
MTLTPTIKVTAEVDGKALLELQPKDRGFGPLGISHPEYHGVELPGRYDPGKERCSIAQPALVAQPQRVVIRARYIKNNQPIGEYSQNMTVVTNP